MALAVVRSPDGRGPVRRAVHGLVVRWLAPVARHPVATVVTGVGLILSGLMEMANDVFTGFETAVDAYHGLILLGLVTGLRGIADLIEGLEWLSRGADESVAQADQAAKTHEIAKPCPGRR